MSIPPRRALVEIVRDLAPPLAAWQQHFSGRPNGGRQMADVDDLAVCKPDRLFHDVLQLPNVAWPAVAREHFHRRF